MTTETGARSNTWVEVDPQKLRDLFADLKGHQGDISSATGKKRSALKEFYKETGLHKAAVDIVTKMDNMTDGARADCIRSLMPLLQHLNETRWAKQQPDFLDDVPAENVVPLTSGQKDDADQEPMSDEQIENLGSEMDDGFSDVEGPDSYTGDEVG